VDLAKEMRRKSTEPPPPLPQLPSFEDGEREDTGRHQLHALLMAPSADDLHTRLDRMERAMAQLLRLSSKSAQVESDVASIAESLDALAQIETLRARRDAALQEWFAAQMSVVLDAVNRRDVATAEAVASEMERRLMMVPRRR
jgi:hypothetical protein